ncbi:hypothetical protein LWI28_019212 [Acer negundo]|uniref:Uncharacterized protein n=1 Tax=Acer negundo TaxID=4023 RepID=A0AAD5NNP6_ACENE|nr:hypothetical protein LWI28_019212 [Acer negundo]
MLSTKRQSLLRQASALKKVLKIEPSPAKHPKTQKAKKNVQKILSPFIETSSQPQILPREAKQVLGRTKPPNSTTLHSWIPLVVVESTSCPLASLPSSTVVSNELSPFEAFSSPLPLYSHMTAPVVTTVTAPSSPSSPAAVENSGPADTPSQWRLILDLKEQAGGNIARSDDEMSNEGENYRNVDDSSDESSSNSGDDSSDDISRLNRANHVL